MRCSRVLLALLGLASSSTAQTLIVPDDHATIQGAVDASQSGYTVRVRAGTYNENIDLRGKEITLLGESGALATTITAQGLAGITNLPGNACVAATGATNATRIEGFTLTGGSIGVYCIGGSPSIVDCVITGIGVMSSFTFPEVPVIGEPLIEGCTISGNDLRASGLGAVTGTPVIRDSVIEDNIGYSGVGILLQGNGALIERCVIRRNTAEEGAYGAAIEGGGALVRRCVIVDNHAVAYGMYTVLGAAVANRSTSGQALVLENCTVANNTFFQPTPYPEDTGGISGNVSLVSCIAWGNDGLDVRTASGLTAAYSDIGNGLTGGTNLSVDPQFVAAAQGDYRLQSTSPCIDAGDPATFDPDLTRADIGALFFTQPATFHGCSGTNTAVFSHVGGEPRIGQTLSFGVTGAQSVGKAAFMFWSTDRAVAGSPCGLVRPFGEVLIGLAPGQVLGHQIGPASSSLSGTLPLDPLLVGSTFFGQGGLYDLFSSSVELSNGLRIVVGAP